MRPQLLNCAGVVRSLRSRLQSLFARIQPPPLLFWVYLGFGISYLLFFIRPAYLSADVMSTFDPAPPSGTGIGGDLRATLAFARYWLAPDQVAYNPKNNYPPLTSLLFAPLAALPFRLAYKTIILASLLSFGFGVLLLPRWMSGEQFRLSVPAVLCVTGLVSYGLQFQLERGQFDLITVLPALLAVWIYHRHHAYRWVAYLLFILSVQLKLFPAIFAIMLIHDWRDWKNNLRRMLLLALANVLLFLVFGLTIFSDFVSATRTLTLNPYIAVYNHSIRAALTFGLHGIPNYRKFGFNLKALDRLVPFIQLPLSLLVICCLFLIVLRDYRQKRSGINPHLLLACTIGSLLLPPTSFDYRLPILAAPAVLFLWAEAATSDAGRPSWQVLRAVMILAWAFAYSSTLFTADQKPPIVANNCPALFVMLGTVTVLALQRRKTSPSAAPVDREPAPST